MPISARAPAGFEPDSVAPYSLSVVFAEFASVSAVACKLSPCLWEVVSWVTEVSVNLAAGFAVFSGGGFLFFLAHALGGF